ncbi:hypothetical protein L611_003300000050 [Aminobacter sp. J15]|nr:hypothetical protein L611_003300000050 [Aminobacter sp. J15]
MFGLRIVSLPYWPAAASSGSMISLKRSTLSTPLYISPFTKKVGVESTPNSCLSGVSTDGTKSA